MKKIVNERNFIMELISLQKQLDQLDLNLASITYAQSLIFWDAATAAPKNSVEHRSLALTGLSTYYYNTLVSESTKKCLDELERHHSAMDTFYLSKWRFIRDLYNELAAIPVDEYAAFKGLQAKSSAAWEEAKKAKDFSIFEPFLQQVIDYKRRMIQYRGYKDHPYNLLLDDHEKNLTVVTTDQFFDTLREELVPIIKQIHDNPPKEVNPFPIGPFTKEQQWSFSKHLMDLLGFNQDSGILALSEHPFTLNLSASDVRITTHFYENDLLSGVTSTIHECGHALYEQNINKDFGLSLLATGTSMGIHESQSRFYENNLGRSMNFWESFYPQLVAKFPDAFSDYDLEDFYAHLNRVKNTLIRIDADELTYSLHIMIRYELEKAIFENKLEAKDLPQAWSDKYESYMGIRPSNDAEGVLQDVHWSEGLFGYFPSYALGSAYACQFEAAMKKELSIEDCLKDCNLAPIKDWLTDKIYQYGATKTPDQLLIDVTGEPFNPKYFLDYLKNKYTL